MLISVSEIQDYFFMHISFSGLFAISVFIIFIIRQVVVYKKQLDKQNIKLFHFYLDQQLIAKLIKLANVRTDEAFQESVETIKDYYNVSDILIYSHNLKSFIYPMGYDEWLVERYLLDNENRILAVTKKKEFVAAEINIASQQCKLYIASFDKNNLIIFIFKDSFVRQEIDYVLDLIRDVISLVKFGAKDKQLDSEANVISEE
jgi:hypothetical protein